MADNPERVNKKRKRMPPHPMVLNRRERYDQTLEEWLAARCKTQLPIRTIKPFRSKPLRVLARYLKKPMRSIIGLVYDIHESGYCLKQSNLTPENLVVSHGIVLLKVLDLEPKTVEGCAKNFKSVKKLIKHTFCGGYLDLPIDLRHLLNLLSRNPVGKQLLVKNHFSVMNEKSRSRFVEECYSIKEQFTANQQQYYESACAKLTNQKNWYTFWDPSNPLAMVYRKGRNRQIYSGTKADQPQFHRNSVSHVLENCGLNSGYSNPLFTNDECLDMMLAIPQMASNIVNFSEYLFEANLLASFSMEQYFDDD